MDPKLKYPHNNTKYIGKVDGISCYLSVHDNNYDADIIAFNHPTETSRYEEQAISTINQIEPPSKAEFWNKVYKLVKDKNLYD